MVPNPFISKSSVTLSIDPKVPCQQHVEERTGSRLSQQAVTTMLFGARGLNASGCCQVTWTRQGELNAQVYFREYAELIWPSAIFAALLRARDALQRGREFASDAEHPG